MGFSGQVHCEVDHNLPGNAIAQADAKFHNLGEPSSLLFPANRGRINLERKETKQFIVNYDSQGCPTGFSE